MTFKLSVYKLKQWKECNFSLIIHTYIFKVDGNKLHVACVLAVHTILLIEKVIPRAFQLY